MRGTLVRLILGLAQRQLPIASNALEVCCRPCGTDGRGRAQTSFYGYMNAALVSWAASAISCCDCNTRGRTTEGCRIGGITNKPGAAVICRCCRIWQAVQAPRRPDNGGGSESGCCVGVRRLGKRLVGVETSVAKELARPAPKQRTAPAPWRRAEARGQKILPIRAIRLARGSAPWEKSRDCQAAGQLLGLYSISRPTSSAPRQRRSRTKPAATRRELAGVSSCGGLEAGAGGRLGSRKRRCRAAGAGRRVWAAVLGGSCSASH